MAADNIVKISTSRPYFCTVEALSPEANPADSKVIKYGVSPELIQSLREQRQYSRLAQFFGLVRKGLILADHLFVGLNRDLYYKGDMDSDDKCLIYIRRPEYDYEWNIEARTGEQLVKIDAKPKRVFAVVVRAFDEPGKDNVIGTIRHWNWVKEEPESNGKPIDHQTRYNDRKWSRKS